MDEYEKIVEFVFNNSDCRNKDVMDIFLSSLLSETENNTIEGRINRKLRKLKNQKIIIYDPHLKRPRYRVNPAIKDITKEWKQQITESDLKVEVLLKKEENYANSIIGIEKELKKRILDRTKISILFKDEEINRDMVFQEGTKRFFDEIAFSLINGIIESPETWKPLNIPFNFECKIESDLKEDPIIFTLINKLRDEFKKAGRIFKNWFSFFNKDVVIELSKENIGDIKDMGEQYYQDTFYKVKYIKKKDQREKKELQKEILKSHNYFPERLEIEKLSLEENDKLEKIIKDFKGVVSNKSTKSPKEMTDLYKDLNKILSKLDSIE